MRGIVFATGAWGGSFDFFPAGLFRGFFSLFFLLSSSLPKELGRAPLLLIRVTGDLFFRLTPLPRTSLYIQLVLYSLLVPFPTTPFFLVATPSSHPLQD